MQPVKTSLRPASTCVGLVAMLTMAATAQAQTLPPPVPDTTITVTQPLLDPACDQGPPSRYYTCRAPAGRKVAVTSETATLLYSLPDFGYGYGSYKTYRYDRNYHVEFSGDLAASAAVMNNVSAYSPPGYLRPVGYFFPQYGTVNADLSYDATGSVESSGYDFQRVTPDAAIATGFATVSNLTARVNSIMVSGTDLYSNDPVAGIEYSVDLSTPDPSAVTNNSVNFTGVYQGTGNKIVFGTISGKARARFGSGADSYLYSDPALTSGAVLGSLAQLDLELTAQVTTVLDETGLITPTVAVTQGIRMNGSRVSGLGAAINPDDAVNKAQLDAEAGTRLNADLALQNGINTEVAARTAADLAINQRIAIEESSRTAMGAALTKQVDLLGTRVDQLQSQVELLDKHIASSTAVAVAMSGNAFLPDMTFNLTANVGTYDGAHAGSIQIGALVSRHVAINAGLATGFNKGGKTAGRVGMTFGW